MIFQMSINFTIKELKEELHMIGLTIVLRSRHDIPDVYKFHNKIIDRRPSHKWTDMRSRHDLQDASKFYNKRLEEELPLNGPTLISIEV